MNDTDFERLYSRENKPKENVFMVDNGCDTKM